MATPPTFRFSQFNVASGSPIGSRHLTTHPTYVKQLSTNVGGFLDFGSLNISNGKRTTLTKAVVAMVDAMNGANEKVFNLRFWLSNINDFGPGTYYFNGEPSGVWIQNAALTDASGHFTPFSLPSGQNIWRQDGWTAISGAGSDSEVTQFMYLSVTSDQDVPPGVYGGNSGGFTYRLTVDYK